ncbi:hydantoinase/oxoprolinase family protein [Conexibacter sp. CPCC 206217]|uniref:hydantoinase/oxoprolinase family protein n=1 Tax=Conexibacter sp. CPCC 206217 TaxID=3064574 RepID=UPI002722B48E|nr:hydantoinase/oxoprolinase family protein [Conexibacter sp. CPCC 206217]MDO8213290.1 hydantoinase/oxoprolinase family protein [Conexibacter sp. CPCC 206217]
MLLVGIDIGGTFTDLALYDSDAGRVAVHKVRSTPDDPGRALVTGIVELCAAAGVAPGDLDGVLHGTTVATNAVLEHRGARTGMVTTEGVRDVVHIGRHQRPEPYSVMLDIPWQATPFVRRAHRLTVPERIASSGEVIVALDEERVRSVARALGEAGVEAVAICFLFSYVDAAHEQRAAEIVREELPAAFVTTSADVSPQFREFERFTTAAMNAFVGPGTGRYLERLTAGLEREGVGADLLVMRSNGGVASVAEAAARPVTLMLSGPAAGVLGARWAAGLAGRERLITFDMGGTSADIGIVTEDGVAEASARDTEIAGFPLLVPMFDIQTIGAGGGSIARLDEAGGFRVGPRSAGAVPGPACYGFGGTEATISDAHLVLGRLDPERFLGGDMALDTAAAEAVVDRLAGQLGLDRLAAAEGILRLANASMAQTIRSITVERGHDPRDFSLVAFGGAGPLHAAELADAIGIREVVVPPHPGITSAAGLLTSDLRYDHMRTVFMTEGAIDGDAINRQFEELAGELLARLLRDGADAADVTIERALDCRYAGQGYELRIPAGKGFTPQVLEAFHAAHRAEYGHHFADPIELVNLRVTVSGPRPKLERVEIGSGTLEQAQIGEQTGVWRVGDELVARPTRQLLRERLPLEEPIAGPAIVFQRDTTVVVPPGWSATATPGGALLLNATGVQHGAAADDDVTADGATATDQTADRATATDQTETRGALA